MTDTGQHSLPAVVSHYRLLSRLGAGGMGEVYLAQDTHLDRKVAIKFLSPRATTPELHRRLLHEARAAAALDHPNICAVYEVAAESVPPFIVMQYVEGETLAARLRRGPLPPDEAVRLALEIADALGAAHGRGIVHRDVKPHNIILTPRGRAKLLDFGLARQRPPGVPVDSQPTQTSTYVGIVGTPAYMAPEQIQGGEVDGRTDLFALGAVLYESLTGMPPFSGRNQLDVYGSVLHVEPPAPSSLAPRVTPAHDEVCARLLKKNPDERFQSAGEALTALRSLQAGTLRIEPAISPGRRFGRPFVWAVAGLLAVVGLTVGWLLREPALSIEPSPDAARSFVEGVSALREGAYVQARRHLHRTVELDPGYPLGWTRLAEAQLELDEEERARESVLRAVNLVDDRSRLPEDERLAFEATIGMVQRDYATAQRSYTALIGRQPSSAPLRLDLGRAYEADEAIGRAIEQYTAATKLDPENPAAFLRLGIIYARQDQVTDAIEAFERAERLYVASGRVDGVAAVYYQRGVMYAWLDRVEEARAALDRARTLAETADSAYLRAAVMFRLSSLAGLQGRYDEAETVARQALEIGEGLNSLTAFGLVDLGNVFAYAGQHPRAAQYFEQARRLASAAGARRAEARARLATASLQLAEGKVTRAREHARAALKYYEEAGFRGLRAVALTVLASAQARSGDLEGAQRIHEDLLAFATERGAASQIAEQHNQLATLLLAREQYAAALDHVNQALAGYRAVSSPYYSAQATLVRAEILARLGRMAESARELDDLFRPGSNTGDPTREFERLRALRRAALALAANRPAEAGRLAGSALEGSADAEFWSTTSELEVVAALAEARAGRPGASWAHLERAEQLVERFGDPPDPVMVSRIRLARAEVLLAEGRSREALELAVPLADRCSKESRFESAWLSYSVAARAAAHSGRSEDARRLEARARAASAALQRTMSEESWSTLLERRDLHRFAIR